MIKPSAVNFHLNKYLYSVSYPLALKIFKVRVFVCCADGVPIKHLVLFTMRSLFKRVLNVADATLN